MTTDEDVVTLLGPRSPDAADAVVLELPGDVPDLAEARRWTGEVLADLTEEEVADAKLVVSELVTNAYEHGRHPLLVRLRRGPDLIGVEVTDLSPRMPVMAGSPARAARGRGMVLVDRLSRRWGAVRHAVGKTVWAVLSRRPDAALPG